MHRSDIPNIKIGEDLIWHKPGTRYKTTVEYRGPYGDGRIWVRVGDLLTTANIRNCTRPVTQPAPEAK